MFQVARLYISVRHSSASVSFVFLASLLQGIGSGEVCMCLCGALSVLVHEDSSDSDCSSSNEFDSILCLVGLSKADDTAEGRDLLKRERSISWYTLMDGEVNVRLSIICNVERIICKDDNEEIMS